MVAENQWDQKFFHDMASYVKAIKYLAPQLEQIHLRIGFKNGSAQPEPLVADCVTLINLLRKAYTGSDILIGFHPDTSYSSIADWSCVVPTVYTQASYNNMWQCVTKASVDFMNQVNVSKKLKGKGFEIYSIEQSYVQVAVPAKGVNLPTSQVVKTYLKLAFKNQHR